MNLFAKQTWSWSRNQQMLTMVKLLCRRQKHIPFYARLAFEFAWQRLSNGEMNFCTESGVMIGINEEEDPWFSNGVNGTHREIYISPCKNLQGFSILKNSFFPSDWDIEIQVSKLKRQHSQIQAPKFKAHKSGFKTS